MNVERWVETRLSRLETPEGWRPDAAGALVRMRERDRAYCVRRRRWTWIAAAASFVSLSVLAIPGRCDSPGSTACGQPLAGRIWREVFPPPVKLKPWAEVIPQAQPAPVSAPLPPGSTVAQTLRPVPVRKAAPLAAPVTNFKEFGVPNAPIACEIYTDYECPACAALYRQTIPQLIAEYVQSGKVKLLHRDFPLNMHPFARLAARYANAAGRLGQYDVVVNQLFRTQDAWGPDGSVDHEVAQVLAPGVMQQVRELVQNDGTLDDTVAGDIAMGLRDEIHRTPTIIVVSKGKRQPIEGVPDYTLLKQYLDQLLR